ncbi:NAD(P)/FAD-dependent oxidoreductase [Tunicatimonas pelagia]|uniref:NAD(P)/FAD-dependent oxidoreductase n=1 Tax=Tunicatimonas pelagia TaxID=931531 RepID=UPI002665D4E8|nr:FAD-dependent oxidoreductase [Tunicatimonas pelagia]WKN41000.1 FAD-dependent oxidoreductase [Tunicatimonas pelagia]
MTHVCIIGNGIAGITAARNIRKLKPASDFKITVISAETDHFFSRTALMYIYMGHMTYEHTKPYEDWFWEKNNIELVRDYAQKVDASAKTLSLQSGGNISYDVLVLASGSSGNRAGWPGEELKGIQGMITYQDIEAMEGNTENVKQAVIVGGGLIGVEMAECLHARHIPVTFFIREKEYWSNILPPEESKMISRHVRENGINLLTERSVKEFRGDSQGRVSSVVLEDGEEHPCQFVGITIGVHPNIKFLEGSGIETNRGIMVDEQLRTNVPDVYAVGDCAQHHNPPSGRRPLEQIWYSGRMQGETVAKTICGNPMKYVPGIFFNSAKFFDIEYQVYGQMNAHQQDFEEQFYWEHPDGEKAVRIAFDRESGLVIGFNLMGIRFRHEVCERWLREKRSIEYVVEHLEEANFDPEFYQKHEDDIARKFIQDYPNHPIKRKRKGAIAAFFGL